MSNADVMMEHSREILRQSLGSKLEKMEITTEKTKTINIIDKNLEMSIHKVVGGGYDIHIYGKNGLLKESYIIRDISKKEMKGFYNNLKQIYRE